MGQGPQPRTLPDTPNLIFKKVRNKNKLGLTDIGKNFLNRTQIAKHYDQHEVNSISRI